jgi:betaine-aldehyde dehydrogenase
MAAPAGPLGRTELWIDGAWVSPASGGSLAVISPSTEAEVGRIGAATAPDVDLAVAAARRAFAGWSRTSGADRATVLRAIAAGVLARKQELAVLESTDMGKPLDEALWDMDDVASCFEARVLSSRDRERMLLLVSAASFLLFD